MSYPWIALLLTPFAITFLYGVVLSVYLLFAIVGVLEELAYRVDEKRRAAKWDVLVWRVKVVLATLRML